MLGLTSEIKVKVTSEDGCLTTLAVELSKAKVQQKIEEAFKNVQSQAKLPGFRPGKAPIEMVRDSFRGAAYERAQDLLLQEGVSEALKVQKINPIQSPIIKTAEFTPDKPFNFVFEVEAAPVVKLAAYKGLKLNKKVKSVTDKDIQKTMDQLVEGNSRLIESKAETLEKTQFAVIDYEGSIDGKPIEGAKTENFLMDMSAPQTIAGLADGLIGCKVGESREVKVKFPDDSPAKELAGKEALFNVKLNAIKEKSLPTVDDEFAKDMGLESLAKLKEKIQENLVKEQERAIKNDLEKQVIDGLIEAHKFSVPASLVEKQFEQLVQRQSQRLLSQGFPKDSLDKLLEQGKPEIKRQADREIRLAYILNAITDAEKIEATEEDVNAKIQTILDRSNPTERPMLEKALKGSYRDQIYHDVREEKAFSWLIEQAKIKDIPGGS